MNIRILIRQEKSSTKNIKSEYIYYTFFMVIMCWFVDNVARLISLTFEDLQQSTTCHRVSERGKRASIDSHAHSPELSCH